MSAVMLVSSSTDLARRLRLASDDALTVLQPQQLPAGPAQLLTMAAEPETISSVVIDLRGPDVSQAHVLDLAAQFDADHPQVGVVLVSEKGEELALSALRVGVRDVLEADASVEDLRWVLKRVESASQRVRPMETASRERHSGRVITVASPKGGVGKTTVATNLARSLVDQSPQGTVLVDLDVQFGDVAAALDLDPVHTLAEILAGPALDDPIALKSLLTRHPSGLQVACGVKTPVEAEGLTAENIGRLLELLKREFRFVVIDTAPGMTEQTLTALDHTTDLVLVTSLDVPGVRGMRKELELLDQLGMHPYTRHVVVNYFDRTAGLSIADVESTIGRRVDVVLPRAASVMRSTNVGVPLVQIAPGDRVSKELLGLSSRFSPRGAHRRQRRAGVGRR